MGYKNPDFKTVLQDILKKKVYWLYEAATVYSKRGMEQGMGTTIDPDSGLCDNRSGLPEMPGRKKEMHVKTKHWDQKTVDIKPISWGS